MDDLFKGFGIQISLDDEDSFLKVRETLTRIGIASRKEKTLYPSCYILHKRGEYAILHFKELFALDGKSTDICENDIARRNTIALLLQDWELLKIKSSKVIEDNVVDMSQIKILTHKEKSDWNIHHKYSIGAKKPN
jgi:Bacteriophage translational regulator